MSSKDNNEYSYKSPLPETTPENPPSYQQAPYYLSEPIRVEPKNISGIGWRRHVIILSHAFDMLL